MGSHREKWHNFRCQLVFNSFIRPTNIVVLIRHLPSISLCYWAARTVDCDFVYNLTTIALCGSDMLRSTN